MPRKTERIALPAVSPGTERFLILHRYGTPGARPKAYLQASLHADEWPGQMALHHLIPMLDEADAAGRLTGEIVIMAYANPVGMHQRVGGEVLGRFAFDGSGNFNRSWPDLTEAVAAALDGALPNDPDAAVAAVRQALSQAAAGLSRRTEVLALRAILLNLSIDADTVLDIHCDQEALLHLYANIRHQADVTALAADLAAPVVMLEEEAGGGAFDEANARVWWKLAERGVPGADTLPAACFACTVELRGRNDVDDDLGARDAAGLFNFLIRQGNISGDAGSAEPLVPPYRLDEVDTVHTPVAGLLSYKVPLDCMVTQGDLIAEIIDPTAEEPTKARTPVHAGTSGHLFTRFDRRMVAPGEIVAKIAGRAPLDYRQKGNLLSD